jgi:uncharacterized protein (TIGR00730 family)
MKVCVCGGTNSATNEKFLRAVEDVATAFCDNDIELIWGGAMRGVLGVIYGKYLERHKPNTLILPRVYKDDLKGMTVDKVKITKTISERTDKMYEMADAIVFLPGGIGTIYEFWCAIEGLRAREHHAKIILYNYENFFKTQIDFFDFITENGFTTVGKGSPYKIGPKDLFTTAKTPKELMNKLLKIGK